MIRKRVLLIDDDEGQRELVGRVLERDGCTLVNVSDAASALEKLSADSFDLVITEMALREMDGLDLLRTMKERNLSQPAVMVTARATVGQAVEAMKLGARDVLLKPLNASLIRAFLAQGVQSDRASETDWGDKKHAIITRNPWMTELLDQAREIADSRASVLIQGESGTGKELFARYIHMHGNRKDRPFIAVNCSALPEALLESEILGHEKGAFTGAIARKKGKFELADQGTLLLDEISEMAYSLQSKLLRVLQEKEVDRIGGALPVAVDVRVMATTNQDMETLLTEGRFREDLFYRLNVIPFRLPPLRERKDDIPLLARFFVEKYALLEKRSVKDLTDEAVDCLVQLPWRGNVRELENTLARAVLFCRGEKLEKKDLFLDRQGKNAQSASSWPLSSDVSLKEIEKKTIFHALDRTNGNRTHAAEILGISVRTLRNKLNEYRESMRAT